MEPERSETPNFPHYEPPSKGVPLLPHPTQGKPLIKLSMRMLQGKKMSHKPFKGPRKATTKITKRVKFY